MVLILPLDGMLRVESNRIAKPQFVNVLECNVIQMNTKNEARRGEKMLLWSILDAGNYRYLIEYTFSDDGVITSRIGATVPPGTPVCDSG